jgi:hypothetical protein
VPNRRPARRREGEDPAPALRGGKDADAVGERDVRADREGVVRLAARNRERHRPGEREIVDGIGYVRDLLAVEQSFRVVRHRREDNEGELKRVREIHADLRAGSIHLMRENSVRELAPNHNRTVPVALRARQRGQENNHMKK